MRKIPETMLIIDNDLGFVFWLGHLLEAASHSALPAKSVPDAALLVLQLDLTVDVMVINLALSGSLDFIAALHRTQKNLRVITIRDDVEQTLGYIPGVHASHPRPAVLDEAARVHWVRCIESVMLNHETQRSYC